MTPDVEHDTLRHIGGRQDRLLLGRLGLFARPHLGALLLAVLLLMAGLGLQLVGPYLIREAVDGPFAEAARTRGTPAFDLPALTDQVTTLGLAYLGVAASLALLMLVREWLMARTGQLIVLSIRNTLFHHVLRLPSAWFDRHHVGWTVTRTTSDVDALSELFTTGVATIAYDLLTIVVVLANLAWLSPELTVVAVVVLPVMTWVSFRFRLKARTAYRATRRSLSLLNGFLQERLTGLDVVRLFRRERASGARFAELNGQYYADNMVTVKHFSVFFPTVDVLSWVIRLGTLCWASWLIADGDITLGVFINFWMLLDFVFQPIRELAERYNVLQAAMAAGERIVGILDSESEDGAVDVATTLAAAEEEERRADDPALSGGSALAALDAGGARQATDRVARATSAGTPADPDGPRSDTPKIAFDQVSFAYGDGPDVLHEMSFTIPRGHRVAVVGHTGAGKTTLVSLLCRFREVDRGSLRLDGVPVGTIPHRELRRRIAIVQQDVFLFSDTIAANIRMGNPDLTDEQVAAVARAVNADRFIERLPDGYQTRLAERGANLSSGQRQLIAFARALAADPEILVLDEATSSVDSETEAWIEEATGRLLAGRTSVVIAHRLSTVINADRILVLHKGELRESGTHDELLAAEGLYHRLYHLHLAASV